jgi:tetratricopeptide (TPR) repeat protein
VEAYEAALHEEAGLAVAHYNRATVLYRMGMFAEAEAGFAKAVQLDSYNTEFQLGLSSCRQALRPECNT